MLARPCSDQGCRDGGIARPGARALACGASATALLWAIGTQPAAAAPLHGRLQLTGVTTRAPAGSLDASLGNRTWSDIAGDLRLIWDAKSGPWDFSAHYELAGEQGHGVQVARANGQLYAAAQPTTLFDLSHTIARGERSELSHEIDRLSVGYTSANYVWRIGRQALSWGAGIVFRPMDLIDPFAPEAIDTEYKPGTDMLYVQRLFDDGADLQLIVAPRAPRAGVHVTASASTVAMHYRRRIGPATRQLGATFLLASDRDDWTLALGLSGPLRGAAWNVELLPTLERSGRVATSLLANLSNALTLWRRNATIFAEYYHNGFGVAGHVAVDSLPQALSERLARGQLFDTSRNYLATGMTLEWTPLLSLMPAAIVNVDDGSAYLMGQASWSLSDNASLIAGVQLPLGRRGTEFGGLPVSAAAGPYATPPQVLYLQLRRHF